MQYNYRTTFFEEYMDLTQCMDVAKQGAKEAIEETNKQGRILSS